MSEPTRSGRGERRCTTLLRDSIPIRCSSLATAAFAESALAGFTTVGEFHYLHHAPGGRPYDDPNAMGEALREAAHRAGVRLTLLDACYLSGGIGQPLERRSGTVRRRQR